MNERAQTLLKKVEPRASFTKIYSGVRSQILSAIPTVPGGTLMR